MRSFGLLEKASTAHRPHHSRRFYDARRMRESPADSRYNAPMSKLHEVPVNLATGSYPIFIQPGMLDSVGQQLAGLVKSRKAAIVSDTNVAPRFLPRLEASLKQSGFEAISAIIPAGEEHKTIDHILPVYDRFLSARMERSTPVLALGGGVIGDMTGFVAATILRGVPFVQVPTTLLAMVDASVGGKTGVNHATGKNLIGAFHQPIAVLIDPAVLMTLPERELKGGLAECIKHDIIRDADGFVAADPFEKGERAHLNLGHTFGHAIETVSQYQIAHGEGVALGMCAAAYVATQMGLLSESDAARIRSVIQKAGLPIGGMALPVDQVVDAMFFDKKVAAGKLHLVLPDGLGRATIRDDIPLPIIRDAVASIR
jgi:3-dehydroquinate synthetase